MSRMMWVFENGPQFVPAAVGEQFLAAVGEHGGSCVSTMQF